MAVGDFLSGLGVSMSDYFILAGILAVVIGIVWYLRRASSSGGGSSGRETSTRRRERRFLRWGWKKFLGGLTRRKKIKKGIHRLEKKEAELEVEDKKITEHVEDIIKLIDGYEVKSDSKLFAQINANTKLMLKDFENFLREAELDNSLFDNLNENYRKWKVSLRKENLNLKRDLRTIQVENGQVNAQISKYRVDKKEILKKKYQYVRWLYNGNGLILKELDVVINLSNHLVDGAKIFIINGKQLKSKIVSNKKLYVLRDLLKELLKVLFGFEKDNANQEIGLKKNESINGQIGKQEDRKVKIFAALKEFDKEYDHVVEKEKIEAQQKKKEEQEVKLQ